MAALAGGHRGRELRTATTVGLAVVVSVAILAAVAGEPVTRTWSYVLVAGLGLAMGIQNATARRLAVPDLTTTVLTLTLTGVAADSRLAGGPGGHPGRRLIAVLAMFTGALVGGVLVLEVDLVLPLLLAAALLAMTAAIVHAQSRGPADWARRS
jgi:uncharacterized membrane protein YoaK (UPF0700 family)